MIFTIEALRARHGDCLLLHYGTTEQPRVALIDGGPARVYSDTLRPRLLELHARDDALGQLDDGALRLNPLMVSHIDDDHIHGLLDLTDELISDRERERQPWVRPTTLWHNSFGDLTGEEGELQALAGDAQVQSLAAGMAGSTGLRQAAAVVASVGQGRRLRDEADVLGWPINHPFEELVRARADGAEAVALSDDASLLVLAPRQEQIDELRREWQEQMRRLRAKEASPAELAAYLDQSPYNLASIVCLARSGERTMLLTGDARGDHILEALRAAHLLDGGSLHVDVLKLPHHGSVRNVDTDFFAAITADHYIASGDGRHDNPETETLEMIARSRRGDDDFTIHLTYRRGVGDLDARISDFIATQHGAGRRFGVEAATEPTLSLRVDLGDPLPA